MLGRLYQVSNKSPEAEKAFNAALAADPENEEALTGLAKLYTDLGDTTRAAEKLKVLASKSPNERTLADAGAAVRRTQQVQGSGRRPAEAARDGAGQSEDRARRWPAT